MRNEKTVRPSSCPKSPSPSFHFEVNVTVRCAHCPFTQSVHAVLKEKRVPIMIDTTIDIQNAVGLLFQFRLHAHMRIIGGLIPMVIMPESLAKRMLPGR